MHFTRISLDKSKCCSLTFFSTVAGKFSPAEQTLVSLPALNHMQSFECFMQKTLFGKDKGPAAYLPVALMPDHMNTVQCPQHRVRHPDDDRPTHISEHVCFHVCVHECFLRVFAFSVLLFSSVQYVFCPFCRYFACLSSDSYSDCQQHIVQFDCLLYSSLSHHWNCLLVIQ